MTRRRRRPAAALLALAAASACALAAAPARAQRLFLSKYVHSSGGERAVEVFNPSCLDVALDEFHLVLAPDGGPWRLDTAVPLTASGATVGARDVHAVCLSGAAPAGATCHELAAGLDFDGDDAVGLFHNWVLVDQLGRPGAYSDTAWRDVGGVQEALTHHTLLRAASVGEGLPRWPAREANSTLRSQWTVDADGSWPGLGDSHAHDEAAAGGACPASSPARRVRRLSCGTRGDSAVMTGASGESVQVECPGDCVRRASHAAHVLGGASSRYALSSPVCLAVAHEAAGAGSAPADATTAEVTQARAAASLHTFREPLDAVVLLDAGPGADLDAQAALVETLAGAVEMRLDGGRARLAVLRYGDAASVEQALTGDEAAAGEAARAAAAGGTDSSRDLEAGLDAARLELEARGRLDARRLVVVLGDGGSFGGDYVAAADAAKARGASVAVLTADASGSGTEAAADMVASAVELHVDVASSAELVDAVAPLLGLVARPCAGNAEAGARPRATVTLRTSSLYVVSGSETPCGWSLSPESSEAAMDVAALAEGDVACESDCSEAAGGGRCNRRTGQCECGHGRSGDDCATVACAETCYNGGSCDTSTGQCACVGVYSGPACLTTSCAAHGDCNSRGSCGPGGVCQCRPPYTGPDCSGTLCASPGCGGRGRCDTGTGLCVCESGFFGAGCELRRCPDDCSGRGVCDHATGHCTCDADELTGNARGACGTGRCPNDCSGRGVCDVVSRVCDCNDGYLGTDCSREIA